MSDLVTIADVRRTIGFLRTAASDVRGAIADADWADALDCLNDIDGLSAQLREYVEAVSS